MVQIVRLTWEERYNMYMQHTKEELASMLAERDKYTSPDACKEFEKEEFEKENQSKITVTSTL